MAKKILKGAYTKFEVYCEKCGCQFEYGLEDIRGESGLEVQCPSCNYFTDHYPSNGSNRKEVVHEPETMEEGWCADCQRHTKLFLLELRDAPIPGCIERRWLCKSCYEYHTGKELKNV